MGTVHAFTGHPRQVSATAIPVMSGVIHAVFQYLPDESRLLQQVLTAQNQSQVWNSAAAFLIAGSRFSVQRALPRSGYDRCTTVMSFVFMPPQNDLTEVLGCIQELHALARSHSGSIARAYTALSLCLETVRCKDKERLSNLTAQQFVETAVTLDTNVLGTVQERIQELVNHCVTGVSLFRAK